MWLLSMSCSSWVGAPWVSITFAVALHEFAACAQALDFGPYNSAAINRNRTWADGTTNGDELTGRAQRKRGESCVIIFGSLVRQSFFWLIQKKAQHLSFSQTRVLLPPPAIARRKGRAMSHGVAEWPVVADI